MAASQIYTWTNLTIAFLLELCGLAAFAAWGAHTGSSILTKVGLAVAAPLAAAVVWGAFAAPSAPVRVPLLTMAVKVAFFALAACALAVASHPRLSVAFVTVLVINSTLIGLGGLSASAAPSHPTGPAQTAYGVSSPSSAGRTLA